MITAAEILASLEAEFQLSPDPAERAGAPAETWLVDGGPAKVGVIGSVTRPFCGDCDRIRITAEGKLRTCLFSLNETDLRGPMRDGATDDDLEQVIRDAVWRKELKHRVNEPGFIQPDRPMSAIGG